MGRRILIIDGHPDARAHSLIGTVATSDSAARAQWLGKMRSLGAKAQ